MESQSQHDNDSFVRWQSQAMSQLTNALNLILGLGIAALGYGLQEFKKADTCFNKSTFFIASILLFATASVGLLCLLNRLKDVRITAQNARGNQERQDTKELGKRTWCLFQVMLWLFGLGVFALAIGSVF